MKQWLKRARGAIGMGVIWALVWAPVAVLVGTQIIDPDNSMDEMWFMVGALPGFLSGVVFSAVLSRVARRQRLDDLSVAQVGAWGALAGLLVGILPFTLGDTGGRPWVFLATVVITSITVLSAASAAGSLVLAQRAQKRDTLNDCASLDDAALTLGNRHSRSPSAVAPPSVQEAQHSSAVPAQPVVRRSALPDRSRQETRE